ncbi:MAG: hypothetical protein KGL10_05480 [Alphaproteobacteria bacterium]|nr:hypothetical protein [Alphaproteobacteria bacterium]
MSALHKSKTFIALTAILSAAAITAASIYTVWRAGAGVSQIVAWQAMPAGFYIIRKHAAHLWPALALRFNLVKKETCNDNA